MATKKPEVARLRKKRKPLSFKNIKPGVILTELVGTFTLALVTLASLWGAAPQTLSAVSTAGGVSSTSLIPIPVISAVVIGLFILSMGGVLAAHLNPAVTISLFALRKTPTAEAIVKLISQISGALLAMLVMSAFLTQELTSRVPLEGISEYELFFAEFLGAFLFGFVVAAVIGNKLNNFEAAVSVGLAFIAAVLAARLGSFGLLNPATAIAAGAINWSYILGPIVGVLLGTNVYALAMTKKGKL
jgi:glycerol uptake facilitator protein